MTPTSWSFTYLWEPLGNFVQFFIPNSSFQLRLFDNPGRIQHCSWRAVTSVDLFRAPYTPRTQRHGTACSYTNARQQLNRQPRVSLPTRSPLDPWASIANVVFVNTSGHPSPRDISTSSRSELFWFTVPQPLSCHRSILSIPYCHNHDCWSAVHILQTVSW